MSVLDRAALAALPLLPRPLMRRLASRYIAGERLEDALARLRTLHGQGYGGILDLLGEEVAQEAQARSVVASYLTAARALQTTGLDVYLSVKPTHVGLRISEELALELYTELARGCAELGRFVRVEMEDHTTTDGTLRVFERLRQRAPNVGIVLQSRLLRTPRDIEALASGPLSVRMVKGIYLEPAEIAHVEPGPIREAYVACCAQLFRRGAQVSFATHDDLLAQRLASLVKAEGVGRERHEFQVLLGVRDWLWREWRAAGHAVRVYVPYGPDWRAYSTRRLRNNPQLFRQVARDLVVGRLRRSRT
jgi:proline dehydrogenase